MKRTWHRDRELDSVVLSADSGGIRASHVRMAIHEDTDVIRIRLLSAFVAKDRDLPPPESWNLVMPEVRWELGAPSRIPGRSEPVPRLNVFQPDLRIMRPSGHGG
jgi:hypothetical protein